jgi:hypothetical protein
VANDRQPEPPARDRAAAPAAPAWEVRLDPAAAVGDFIAALAVLLAEADQHRHQQSRAAEKSDK